MTPTSTLAQSCNCSTVFSQSTHAFPFSSSSRDFSFSFKTRIVIFEKCCFFAGSAQQGGAGMQQSTGVTEEHSGRAVMGVGQGQGSEHGGITTAGVQTE